MDVVVDKAKVLGHPGVDSRAVPGAAAPEADDAHLHEAGGPSAHKRTTLVPLWKFTPLLDQPGSHNSHRCPLRETRLLLLRRIVIKATSILIGIRKQT